MDNLCMDNAIVKLTRIEDENVLLMNDMKVSEKLESTGEDEAIKRKCWPVVMVSRLDDDKVQFYSSKQYITVNLTQLDMRKVS